MMITGIFSKCCLYFRMRISILFFCLFFYLHNLSKTKVRNAIYSISKQFVTIFYYFKLVQSQIESKKYFPLAILDKDLFFWIDSLFTFKNILSVWLIMETDTTIDFKTRLQHLITYQGVLTRNSLLAQRTCDQG
jgi:hypothetical protein